MISLMASVPPVLTTVFASPVVRETRRAPNELLSHRGLAPGELTTYEPLAAQWRRANWLSRRPGTRSIAGRPARFGWSSRPTSVDARS
jgi:hypothetical protein